ncbi:uncharacterized protein METZ01_LOCUS582, partial [marine metagenome]
MTRKRSQVQLLYRPPLLTWGNKEADVRIGVLQLDDVRLGFEYREGDGVPIVFM